MKRVDQPFLSLYLCVLLLPVICALGTVGSVSAAEHSQARTQAQTHALKLLTFKTHSRLMVRVDEGVEVSSKNLPGGFSLFLKGIQISDLGMSEGSSQTVPKDLLVESLQVIQKESGVEISGKWKFPTGKATLARPEMETFQYRDLTPPQYVLDFWIKKGPTLAEFTAASRRVHLAKLEKKAQDSERNQATRSLASVQRHALLSDSERFCELPLDESRDSFIEFYPLHQKVDFSSWFPASTPDATFEYISPEGDSEEFRSIRLALKFYREAQLGLVIRSIDFYEKGKPQPLYRNQMKFLRANAMFKLGYKDQANQILTGLIDDGKGTDIALHAALFRVNTLLSNGAAMPALESFFWLIRHYPNHPLKWVFHLGAAECLYSIRQTQQAAKEYRWVMDNAPDAASKAQASFRLNDLYLIRFQYEQALAAQYQALRYFKDQASRFPAFQLNRGETLYQLGQWDRARQVFEEVLEQHPGYPGSWRALYRLGEIAGRLAKQPSDLNLSRKYFSDTVNHYPFAPGATLARLRLIPCGDHGGYDWELGQKFFNIEAKNYTGSNEVYLKNYADMVALARVRATISMGSEKKMPGLAALVTSTALEEINKTKSPTAKKVLTLIANDFFRRETIRLLDANEKFEAIRTYTSLIDQLPKTEDLLNHDYLIRLSEAAAELGMSQLAVKLAGQYQAQAQVEQGAKRGLAQVGPNALTAEAAFAKAKALWLRPERDLSEVRALLSRVPDTSGSAYQKELILGLIDDHQGKYSSAIQHVARAELLNAGAGTHVVGFARNISVEAWLASLHLKAGDLSTALDLYRDLEKRLSLPTSNSSSPGSEQDMERTLGVNSAPDLGQVILAQGEILEKQGKWGELARTYSRALEHKWGGYRVGYEYARALMKTGLAADAAQAQKFLEKIAQENTATQSEAKGESAEKKPPLNETDLFWKKMAQEALETEKRKQSVNRDAKEGRI